MNKVILMGRLTKEVDTRFVGDNIPVASFTIAVDRKFKDKDGNRQTDFHNCKAWRKTAELISTYVSKGQRILVTGELQNGSYEKDGVKKYFTEISVDEIDFIESKSSGNANQTTTQEDTAGFDPAAENELPF